MRNIQKNWNRWLLIPLAVVLVLGTILGVQMVQRPSPVSASGVAATNVSLTGQDTDNDYTYIQFDIGWDYSWRDATNWDAIWVFVKYSVSGGDWAHATLNTTDANHKLNSVAFPTGGVACDAASDGTGVFLYRSGVGTGSVDWDNVELRWEYGTDGLADAATVQVKVFAIEMVYIPTGSFDIGDGNSSNESPNAFHTAAGNTEVNISTTLAGDIHVDTNDYDDTVIETGTGIGIDGDGGLDTDDDGGIDNADFPTGYNAFYVMKYEISQRQYAEFLNTLTQAQQETRTEDTLSAEDAAGHYVMIGQDITAVNKRQGIKAGSNPAEGQPYAFGCDLDDDGNFNESNDGEWIACNYLDWVDGAAYADWAGLRPMTELEFEKISRGPTDAVYAEYAWGSTSITQATGISNGGEAGEVSSNAANAVYGGHASVQGPLRNGALTDSDDSREEAGASYYGVMEMSGNLWERSVTVGNATGRAFTGLHGDGSLDASGDADVTNWPGTDAVGIGFRGGDHISGESNLRASSRSYAALTYAGRGHDSGFRLGRTS